MLEEAVVNRTKNGDELTLNHNDFPAIMVITCVLAVFSVVGTTGNAFVLYVFSRKKDKSTSTVFILALAGTDFFTCLFVMPFTIVVEFMYKKINYDVVCKIYQFLITSNVPFSAFIMVAIAFDRYFCICRPWMKFLNIKFAKRIILSLFIFAITLGLITCLAYGVYHYEDNLVRESRQYLNLTEGANSTANQGTTQAVLIAINSTCCESTTDKIDASAKDAGLIYTGFCYPNEVIIGKAFRKVYQKFYASLFLIAFIIVFILYALIYQSILTRRSKRLRTSVTHRHFNGRRSTMLTSVISKHSNYQDKSQHPAHSLNNTPGGTENPRQNNHSPAAAADSPNRSKCVHDTVATHKHGVNLTGDTRDARDARDARESSYMRNNLAKNGGNKHTKNNLKFREKVQIKTENVPMIIEHATENADCEPEVNEMTTITIYRRDTRKSVREKNRIANIKTAGILFIVTIVFILAFLPAWLMATRLIPANMIVFYMYFSYNVANPVIYAFFNHAFQKEVREVLKCRSPS